MLTKVFRHTAATCLAAVLASPIWAQPSPVVIDGNLWSSSPAEVRKAFVIGAGNMLMLEMAYAKKKGTQPSAVAEKAAAALNGLTLDQITDRISRWYEANPDRRNMPVIGIMWIDMIGPADTVK